MKKIRILALILALLMLPLSVLVGCKNDKEDEDKDPETCNHKWDKWKEEVARDCTHDQVRTRTCRICGTTDTETKPAWGHSLGSWVSDNNASCTEDGTKSKKCDICGYSETTADVGSALGHTFLDSSYMVSEDDEYIEVATCIKCNAATDKRLLGLKIDFEGDKSHLSYTKLDEYYVEGAGSIETKTEGEGEDANSYLSIKRDSVMFAGNSAFGLILTPRASMLKGASLSTAPYYVVEFDVRINKENTKDLILLSGTKKGVTENFIKYNSADGTLVTAAGAIYTLKDGDYDRWLNIAVVLNDGLKTYTVYVDKYQLVYENGSDKVTQIAYASDEYYLGYDLENLKIGLDAGAGVASSFDVDNIHHYLGTQPKGYEGSIDSEYSIYTTVNGDKIVYKTCAADCEHTYGETKVVPHTCISTGYSIHTCTKCGGQEIFDVSTAGLGNHAFVSDGTTPATCTEAAIEREHCSVCGYKNGTSVGSALGHEIDLDADTTEVIAPTCTDRGYTTGKCIRCGIDHEINYVDSLGHEIDLDNTDSYQIIKPTCLEEGYTIGHCKRCDVSDYVTNKTAAIGHIINKKADDYVKVEADCVTDGYEESTCGRDGCSEKFKTNEVKAYGHSVVSKVVSEDGVSKVVSSCSRCKTLVAEREISTKVPTYTELTALIGSDNMLGGTNGSVLNFDGDSTNVGYMLGDDSKISDGQFGLVPRYSKFMVKSDLDVAGNRYMEWTYSPQKVQGTDSKHAYFDVNNLSGANIGSDVTFEISFRKTAGEKEICPISITIGDRSGVVYSGLHSVQFFNFDKDGNAFLASGLKIAEIDEEWTRFAFVFHTYNATYDVYVDGVMIEQNVTIELGKMSIEEFRTTEIRVQVNDQSATTTRKVDFDEVYAYYSSVPAYVTGVKLNEKSGLAEPDTKKNTVSDAYTDGEGNKLPYLTKDALNSDGSTDTMRKIVIATKENARIYIDTVGGKNVLRFLKNSTIENIPNCIKDAKDSYIDVEFGYGEYTTGEPKLTAVKHQYKTMLLETEFVIGEGTGYFVIAQGRKNDNKHDYRLLTYDGAGHIVSGEDKIYDVEIGKSITVALVMREDEYNYDIYVNGYLMRERVSYPSSYCLDNLTGTGLYRMFYVPSDNNADLTISYINVYGGATSPSLNLGRAEIVKVSGQLVTNAVVFTEDYDYSVHYPSNKKANGDYVYTSSTSTLEIVTGLTKAENDLNLGLVKVDADGNIGDEADEATAVWALKTGDWRSTCTTANKELSGITFYPQNVVMKDGYYDFTGYDSITFKYYVEESNGYKFLMALNSPASSSGSCYYTYYVTVAAGDTGWHELTVPIASFEISRTPSLEKITSISFHFSGWDNGATGGTAGQLGDGTTLYIAGIDLNSKGSDIQIGYYGEGEICADGNHLYLPENKVVVEATAHVNKYEYNTCINPNCKYIDLTVYEGTATGHVPTGDKLASSKDATCTGDGVNYYEIDCGVCGKITVGGKTFKTGHKWVKSDDETLNKAPTCTEDGYDTYVCSGCKASAKMTVAKLGHTKDENVDTIVVEATCTAGGYKQDHCSVCQADYKYDEVEALGHDDVLDRVVSEGDCTVDRVVEYKCTRCQRIDTVTTTAPGHDYGTWTTVTPAGCGDGVERRDCKNCDHYEERPIPGTGTHEHVKVSETAATCGQDGVRVWKCSLCQEIYNETLKATGAHTYGDDSQIKTVAATKDAEGYTYKECTTCGHHKKLSTIPAIFEGTQDLKFEISGDVAIVGKYDGKATEIVIPSTYAGKPVVVSKAAFSGNTAITSVTLGDGVTLAQYAFKGCTALKTVTFGKDVTEITLGAFSGCTALETITIPASVTKIDMLAFENCTGLKTVVLLGTPTTVAANAFKGCDALATVKYVGAKKLVAGDALVAAGNDKFFGATWVCDYKA